MPADGKGLWGNPERPKCTQGGVYEDGHQLYHARGQWADCAAWYVRVFVDLKNKMRIDFQKPCSWDQENSGGWVASATAYMAVAIAMLRKAALLAFYL